MAGQIARTGQRRLASGCAMAQKHGRDKMHPWARFPRRARRRANAGVVPRNAIRAPSFMGANLVKSALLKALRRSKAPDGKRKANRNEMKHSCAKILSRASKTRILTTKSIRMKFGNDISRLLGALGMRSRFLHQLCPKSVAIRGSRMICGCIPHNWRGWHHG